MKKWEEERRKKIYQQKIKTAKGVVNSNNRPASGKKPPSSVKNSAKQSTSAVSSRRLGSRGSVEYMASPQTDPSVSAKMSDLISEDSSYEANEIPVDQTLIFKLLQAFKLQQYAKKMQEFGFGMEIYKLAILNEKEKEKLIDDLRPLPGHQFRFDDMFTFLEAVYPRESAARELKRPGHATQYNKDGENRFLASSNQHPHKTKRSNKSLIKKYERLDVFKRDEINKRFLSNLKIKGGISIGNL
jgi:hypothetical protein